MRDRGTDRQPIVVETNKFPMLMTCMINTTYATSHLTTETASTIDCDPVSSTDALAFLVNTDE